MWDALQQEMRIRGSATFAIRAVPGAPKTEAVEVLEDDSVKIRIAAPPEGGKANAELIRFLAKEFGVPRGNISIVAGAGERRKLVRVRAEMEK